MYFTQHPLKNVKKMDYSKKSVMHIFVFVTLSIFQWSVLEAAGCNGYRDQHSGSWRPGFACPRPNRDNPGDVYCCKLSNLQYCCTKETWRRLNDNKYNKTAQLDPHTVNSTKDHKGTVIVVMGVLVLGGIIAVLSEKCKKRTYDSRRNSARNRSAAQSPSEQGNLVDSGIQGEQSTELQLMGRSEVSAPTVPSNHNHDPSDHQYPWTSASREQYRPSRDLYEPPAYLAGMYQPLASPASSNQPDESVDQPVASRLYQPPGSHIQAPGSHIQASGLSDINSPPPDYFTLPSGSCSGSLPTRSPHSDGDGLPDYQHSVPEGFDCTTPPPNYHAAITMLNSQ